MSILRIILIGIIVYLLVSPFIQQKADNNQENRVDKIKFGGKKISKSIGEYVDYEEVDKNETLKPS